ncbi:hypothetical protein C8Q77DRAFT_841843 [Trametes polyzona]|nr:hypothetical protein C8Q77DRAFT_841843 [Trametes polyzona]
MLRKGCVYRISILLCGLCPLTRTSPGTALQAVSTELPDTWPGTRGVPGVLCKVMHVGFCYGIEVGSLVASKLMAGGYGDKVRDGRFTMHGCACGKTVSECYGLCWRVNRLLQEVNHGPLYICPGSSCAHARHLRHTPAICREGVYNQVHLRR